MLAVAMIAFGIHIDNHIVIDSSKLRLRLAADIHSGHVHSSSYIDLIGVSNLTMVINFFRLLAHVHLF
jgi:hypothetical protein